MQRKTSARLPAAERREQILDVARSLFVQRGVERTSMREIAAKAGITATAIYDHFADKEDLLYQIGEGFFSAFIEHSQAATQGVEGVLERFNAMGRAYISFGVDHPEEYRLVFMTPIAGIKRQKGMFNARMAPGPDGQPKKGAIAYGLLENTVAEMMEQDIIRRGNPRTVSEAVWAAMHGLVALLITHEHFEFSPVDDLIEATTSMILDGLLPH